MCPSRNHDIKDDKVNFFKEPKQLYTLNKSFSEAFNDFLRNGGKDKDRKKKYVFK